MFRIEVQARRVIFQQFLNKDTCQGKTCQFFSFTLPSKTCQVKLAKENLQVLTKFPYFLLVSISSSRPDSVSLETLLTLRDKKLLSDDRQSMIFLCLNVNSVKQTTSQVIVLAPSETTNHWVNSVIIGRKLSNDHREVNFCTMIHNGHFCHLKSCYFRTLGDFSSLFCHRATLNSCGVF